MSGLVRVGVLKTMDKQTIELTGKKYEHTLSYEVMQKHLCISETVATYKTYEESWPKLMEVYKENHHVSIDLVVRDGYGTPVFRQALIELDACDNTQQTYSDPYGVLCPYSAYNADYKDYPNEGREFYTRPTKLYK